MTFPLVRRPSLSCALALTLLASAGCAPDLLAFPPGASVDASSVDAPAGDDAGDGAPAQPDAAPAVDVTPAADAAPAVDAGVPVDTASPVDAAPASDVAADVARPVDAPPAADVAPDVAVTGVACPGSIAGNGQPCASVGEGCGGVLGGGICGDAYACSCASNHRWQCASMRVPCDAGAPDVVVVDAAAPDAGPAACSLVGTYSFRSPLGITMYLRMRADGMWAYATSTAALDASSLNGVYAVADDLVTIRETGGSLEGCSSTAMGVYRVSFAAGCGTATLRTVSDACGLRGVLLGGRGFSRIGG